MIDKKTFSIGILFLTAIVLFAANLIVPTPTAAETAVKDRDYQLVTTPDQQGGESLFVTDNRTGMVAILAYDPAARTVQPKAVKAVSEAFGR